MYTTREYDATIQSEVRSYFRLLDSRGHTLLNKRILDLGAHKGFFSRAALDAGAAFVCSVEPCSDNLTVLRKNARGATILHGACVGWAGGKVALTKSPRMSSDAAYSVARHHSTRIDVEMVNQLCFADLVTNYKIDTVKMDFQGSEWGVFIRPIPKSVRLMFGEMHYSGRFDLDEGRQMEAAPLKDKKATEKIFKGLEAQGFKLWFRKKGKWQRRPEWNSKDRFQDVIFERS